MWPYMLPISFCKTLGGKFGLGAPTAFLMGSRAKKTQHYSNHKDFGCGKYVYTVSQIHCLLYKTNLLFVIMHL